MARNPDKILFGSFFATFLLILLVNLAVVGVAIWAVIALVNHITA